ncbi:MAG TPA: hypothetical protein VK851_05890 [Anaerolineales bacterium]|nr:hypothetical protein [Anaerolineales bacterium]
MLLSTALDALYEKVNGLGKRKSWFLLLVAVFIFITLINGVDIVPEESYQRLSQNPFTTRTDIHFNNYWQESLLLPLLAYYLGLTGTITFNILAFAMIAGALVLFALLAHRHWGSTLALISTALLITGPLTTILLSWLGTPDGATFALTVPFLFVNSGPLIFLLALLGTANHPAFIIASLEILVLRWAMRDGIRIKHLILASLGIILGYGAVRLFLYSYGIEVVSRFDFMQLKSVSEWAGMNLINLPATLFSLFNIHWLILPVSLLMFLNQDRRFFSLALSMLLLNYAIVFFTLDTTRIFILTSWGVLFASIFHSYRLAESESQKKQYIQALIVIGITSFFTLRYFSWVGEIHTSPFFKTVSQLLK